MALARVNTGDQGVASNIDQFVDLLTGVMTDQPVTLEHASAPLTIKNAAGIGQLQLRSDDSVADPGMPWTRSNGAFLVINPRVASDLYLMWDSMSGGVSASTHIGTGSTTTVYIGEGLGVLRAGSSFLGAISTGSISATTGSFSSTFTVTGAATFDSNVSLPNVGTMWSNSGGAGFIIDRGSFSRAYTGSGNDNSSYSTNLNFNGRTPTIVASCTNAANGQAPNYQVTISGNTINLLISSGNARTYTFNWIAVG